MRGGEGLRSGRLCPGSEALCSGCLCPGSEGLCSGRLLRGEGLLQEALPSSSACSDLRAQDLQCSGLLRCPEGLCSGRLLWRFGSGPEGGPGSSPPGSGSGSGPQGPGPAGPQGSGPEVDLSVPDLTGISPGNRSAI